MQKLSKKNGYRLLISFVVFFVTTSLAAQTVTTLTENLPGGTGGVAVDDSGNIYVADFGVSLSGAPGTKVFKVKPTGEFSVFATGLVGASGNAFDSKGVLFQSNIGANRISRIDQSGQVTTFTSSGFSLPVGIAIDSLDNLFVCNCGNNTIRKVTPAGVSTQFAASGLFNCPNGITFDDSGNLYVANFSNGSVLKVDPSGTVSFFATIPGNNNGHIVFANGDLYVAARGAGQVYKITLSGAVTLLAGTGTRAIQDGPFLQASFSLPNDIAVDPTGQFLYTNDVVNRSNSSTWSPMVVRKIALETIPTSVRGIELKPVKFALQQNYPNPFNPSTQIQYSLESSSHVVLEIYNLVGEKVRTLLSEIQNTGFQTVVWNGQDDAGKLVAGGVYFYKLEAGNSIQTKKMVLIK